MPNIVDPSTDIYENQKEKTERDKSMVAQQSDKS